MIQNFLTKIFPAADRASISSSLGAPSLIPGFEVRLRFDPNPSLTLTEVYNNAIFVLDKILSRSSSDEFFGQYFTYWGSQFQEEIHITSILRRGRQTLQYKHGIQAVYQAGKALAQIPVTTPNRVPRVFARLYLRNQLIGLMQWRHRDSQETGHANATLSLSGTNSTDVVQPMPVDKRAPPFHTIIDTTDNRYVVIYQETGQLVPLSESFSMILEAIATAAQKPQDAFANAAGGVGVGGNFAVNMHRTRGLNTLTWSDIMRTFFLLWSVLGEGQLTKTCTFQLFFDGPELAKGDISSTTVGGSMLVSTS